MKRDLFALYFCWHDFIVQIFAKTKPGTREAKIAQTNERKSEKESEKKPNKLK